MNKDNNLFIGKSFRFSQMIIFMVSVTFSQVAFASMCCALQSNSEYMYNLYNLVGPTQCSLIFGIQKSTPKYCTTMHVECATQIILAYTQTSLQLLLLRVFVHLTYSTGSHLHGLYSLGNHYSDSDFPHMICTCDPLSIHNNSLCTLLMHALERTD